MKMWKLFLSLSLVFMLFITSFAMPPANKDFERNNKGCSGFEKGFCPAQFQQCETFMFLCLEPDINDEPKHHNFKKECSFRFIKDLSQEQKDKIKQIKESSIKISEKIMEDIKTNFDKIDEELSKDKYNQKTIKNLTKEINALYDKKIANKVSERQQIRDVLTSRQFGKMIKKPSKYDKFAERLGLNQEQQEKVEGLFEKSKKELEMLKKDLTDKKVALENEFSKEYANFDIINNLKNDIAELSKNEFKIIVDTKAELKKILNNEQFNKLTRGKKEPRPIPVPKPIKPALEEK